MKSTRILGTRSEVLIIVIQKTKGLAVKSLVMLAVVLASTCGTGEAKEPEVEVVEKELAAAIEALYDGDYDLIIRHTHEKVLAAVGGKKVFLGHIKVANKTLKDAGFSIHKIEFGKIEYFEGKENEFLLIPTNITVKTAGGKDTTPGAQLGVKRKTEKVWKYLDCSALNEELVRAWFPDYPKDKKVPEG